MAKKLEEHLYRSARTREEYVDPATLKFRLHLIAKGGGILKPGDVKYDVEIRDDLSGSSVISRTSTGAKSLGLGTAKDSSKIYSGFSRKSYLEAAPTVLVSRGTENSSPMVGGVGSPLSNMLLQQISSQSAGSSILQKDSPRQEMSEKIIAQQQRRLLLLRHTSKCNSGPQCRTQYCPQMVSVWKHIKKCRDNSCKVSHCLSSRCVLNHYRNCKREGNVASCEICGPVMLQSGENGAMGWKQDDTSVDEFDKFVFGNDSQEFTVSSDVLIPFPEDLKIDGVLDDLHDSVMTQLGNVEPLDAFIHEQNTESESIGGDKPISQDTGLSAGQSEKFGVLQTQSQSQLKEDSGGSVLELQKELDQKQLLSQLIQQQKVFFSVYNMILAHIISPLSVCTVFAQANLFGQNRKLQQKLTLASNMQQAQQLQKEQAICEQLQEQYEQQQQILHDDIQHIISRMHQKRDKQGVRATSGKQATACASDNFTLKRSADQIDSIESLHKKPAAVEYCPSIKGNKGDAEADFLSVESEAASSNPNDNASSKSTSSLIQCMSISDIESHLDSIVSAGQLTPRYISRKCLPLVKRLINHEHGWVFKDAVDPVELAIPDYFDIIENPTDLTLVANKVQDGAYKDVASFERDTKLVFENAIKFNGKDSTVGAMAIELLELFDVDLKNAMKGEYGCLKRAPSVFL